MKKSQLAMMLTGGLGNQLFQLAALLNFANGKICSLESGIGIPRRNLSGSPEISSFQLPEEVMLNENPRLSWLASKSSGYVIRMSLSPRKYEGILVRKIVNFVASSILAIHFRTKRRLYAISNLGFSRVNLDMDKNYFLLGYFQSYKWAQDPRVHLQLSKLTVVHPSTELLEYIDLAAIVKPTIIHIRLGDYKKEDSFGIVPREYYLEALSLIASRTKLEECWLFSDEPDVAINYFTNLNHIRIRVIPEINNSSAETLELMRHGTNYVIGNSSFSWWAAYLSYSNANIVIAPEPWFSNIEEPNDLIPPSWLRLPIIHDKG